MHYRFVIEDAPQRFAHASSLVETADGLLAAWFAGQHEGSSDSRIWLARFEAGSWSDPYPLPAAVESSGLPCWNPVLHVSAGATLLFYRLGSHPRTWHSKLVTSLDHGKTWGPASLLPQQVLGPIKNKALEVEAGLLLCPSSSEHAGWHAHVERYAIAERRWLDSTPLKDPAGLGAIQPTLLVWPEERIQALCRTRAGVVGESWSHDGGKSWSDLQPTQLPNPNSAIDGIVLSDGRAALVLNPTTRARTPLQILLSDDGGRWRPGPLLETAAGEYSYPAIIQSDGGQIHVTYTYDRRGIRHVALDAGELEESAR